MMRNFKSGMTAAIVGMLALAGGAGSARAQFVAQVVSGFPAGDPLVRPIGVTHAPGDYKRLFVWEKAGRIRIIDTTQPFPVTQASATPLLDIRSLVGTTASTDEERGLLGLAFHPNFQTNGKFYVYYSGLMPGSGLPSGFTYYNTVAEYTVANPSAPANPVRTNYGATSDMMRILHPSSGSNNHNGGWMAFGPDGYLYMSVGDGGNFGDTGTGHTADIGNAQNTGRPMGKILRIDVNSPGPAAQGPYWTGTTIPGAANYGIPADNPVLPVVTGGDSPARREIWAYGLRNPWRCSFDRLTGDLWIGDVGQDIWEEINFQPALTASNAAQVAGRNYGWHCYEGTVSYTGCGSGCNTMCPGTYTSNGLVAPVGVYPHTLSQGAANPARMLKTNAATPAIFTGVAVMGGYVYRGCKIPELYGQYVFCDYNGGNLYSAALNTGTGALNNPTQWTAAYAGSNATTPIIGATSSSNMVSFGEDAYGELYQVSQSNGLILKFVPTTAGSIPLANADFDRNGVITVSDIFAFLSAWFALDPRANFNRSTEASPINVADIFAYLGAWFAGCAG